MRGFDTDTVLTESVVRDAIADGYVAAGRYLKNLTAAEVALCARYGLKLWSISEGMGDAATIAQGRPRGASDGRKAAAAAAGLGQPAGTPIFAAVDYDAAGSASISAVIAYMTGFAAAAAPYALGIYGDGEIIADMPSVKGYVAGAAGWSGTRALLANPPPNVALIQRAPIKAFSAGIEIDPVDILDDTVLWLPQAPMPLSVAVEPPMPTLVEAQQFLAARGLYKGQIDGLPGPLTAQAFADLYGW